MQGGASERAVPPQRPGPTSQSSPLSKAHPAGVPASPRAGRRGLDKSCQLVRGGGDRLVDVVFQQLLEVIQQRDYLFPFGHDGGLPESGSRDQLAQEAVGVG